MRKRDDIEKHLDDLRKLKQQFLVTIRRLTDNLVECERDLDQVIAMESTKEKICTSLAAGRSTLDVLREASLEQGTEIDRLEELFRDYDGYMNGLTRKMRWK